MRHLLILFATLFVFLSCSKDDGPTSSPVYKATRTVIAYMAGENDLSSILQEDISEMVAGRKEVADDANLVVFVDKADKDTRPFIARITKDEIHPVDTLYKYEEDFVSSDPEAMRDVIARSIAFCPATRDYGLVLWGHADGWIIESDSVAAARRAYGRDTGDNTTSKTKGKWLNIPSMRQALEATGVHWKFIFCDCCNMQAIEAAYELRNLTDYIIASPAEITGSGAPYDVIVKDFYLQDDNSLVTSLCSDYHAQADYVGGHLPISAIRTSEVEQLASATRRVLPAVSHYLATADDPTLGIIYYYAYDRVLEKEKVMYDMRDMIRAALQGEPEAYTEWQKAFYQAVVCWEMSNYWHANTIYFSDFTVTEERYGGVSMFFPLEKYATSHNNYNETIKRMSWYYAVGWPELGW